MEKVRDDGCGSYTTLCQCRTPTNCQPPKPAEVACHTIKKVLNADEESSMCNADDNTKCDRCYSWKLLPIKFEPATTPVSLIPSLAFKCFNMTMMIQAFNLPKSTTSL